MSSRIEQLIDEIEEYIEGVQAEVHVQYRNHRE